MRFAKVWSKALVACLLGVCACMSRAVGPQGEVVRPALADSGTSRGGDAAQGESPWPALGDPGTPQGGGEKDAALIGGSNAGMVKVPAGKFTLGSNSGGDDEKPAREIYLSEYWIDTYEVTVDQYRACVDAGKCSKPDTSAQFCSGEWAECNNWTQNRGKHPVNCVSWTQADQYCRWAGKRLPTEAQWEKAARGTDGRTYPWGEAVPGSDGRKYGNFADALAKRKWSGWGVVPGYYDGWATTSPVGRFEIGKSPYGAYDMSGNVWEWVSDWYSEDTYQSAPEPDPEGPKSGSKRVYRGGSFYGYRVSWLRAADRGRDEPADVNGGLGFRCARSLH